jgi:hypothetical protein
MTVHHIILIYMCQNAGAEFLPVSVLLHNLMMMMSFICSCIICSCRNKIGAELHIYLHRYERVCDHIMQSRSLTQHAD